MPVHNHLGQPLCGACGQPVDRTDHVLILDGGVYCREMVLEQFGTVGEFIRALIDPTYEGE